MGYTHYWRKTGAAPSDDAWAKVERDFKRLLERLPEHSDSAGGYYADEPLEINEIDTYPPIRGLFFNGMGDLAHEDFYFYRNSETFAFCKTARKPYDLMVCACLIVINTHCQGCWYITSDGDRSDWAPAVHWVAQVLGDGYAPPPAIIHD